MTERAASGPKRFYKTVSVIAAEEGFFAIALDGRPAKTPGRHGLGARSRTLADAIAAEWDAQEEVVTLAAMPLTRLQGFALDGGEAGRAEWAGTVGAFANSDLLCYRAPEPALAQRQAAEWQPWLDRLGAQMSCAFAVTEGVVAVEQPRELREAIADRLDGMLAGEVFAIKLMTEILGSAVLALGVAEDPARAAAAYDAARLDERYQQDTWGVDAEAAVRERRVREEYDAIVRYLILTRA